jgi:RNA polymerase sigma-70 factor (ECF subfamily)
MGANMQIEQARSVASIGVSAAAHSEKSGTTRLDPALEATLLAAVPSLRAFANSLSGSADRADDLVQETLLRAIASIQSFTPGTNMAAWLVTILRHCFCNEHRRRRREAEDPKGAFVATLTSQPAQGWRLQWAEVEAALQELPMEQREAIILIGAEGRSYEDAAEICGCAIGTIKSRTSRARARLAGLLSVESGNDLGPDRAIHAALCAGNQQWVG